jgi:hypothetical protein
MNRMAEKVLPAMNDAEVEDLIRSSYRNDAQTLTTGAEANLLKFGELTGSLTPAEAKRWDEINQVFRRNQKLRGIDVSDRFGQAVAQLASFSDGLAELRQTLASGIDRLAPRRENPPDQDGNGVAAPLREKSVAGSPDGGEPHPPPDEDGTASPEACHRAHT